MSEKSEEIINFENQSLQSVSEGYSSIEYMKHLQLTIVRPKSSNLL